MEWKKLAIPLLVIFFSSILLVVLAIHLFAPQKGLLGIEIIKALLQIATVLILGQLVSSWIDTAKYNRQKEDIKEERRILQIKATNEFRSEMLKKLIETYSNIKKARRLLRAKGLIPGKSNDIRVELKYYDKQMQVINDLQLDLESIKQEIITSKKQSSVVFSDPDLKKHIESMESYIRKILHDYEEKFKHYNGESPSLNSLKYLNEFINSEKTTAFHTNFVEKYHAAINSIRTDMLSGNV